MIYTGESWRWAVLLVTYRPCLWESLAATACCRLLLLPLAPAAETFVAYGDDDATDASSRCSGSDDDVAKFIE